MYPHINLFRFASFLTKVNFTKSYHSTSIFVAAEPNIHLIHGFMHPNQVQEKEKNSNHRKNFTPAENTDVHWTNNKFSIT